MRYININQIKDGMILGKTLYTSNGEVLLRASTEIKQEYVDRIKELDYTGIYIQDEETKDIEINEVISEELKISTVKNLKSVYMADSKKSKLSTMPIGAQNLKESMYKIVDDVLDNSDVMINIADMKSYDDVTFFHSVNVAVLALAIGLGMDFNRKDMDELAMAAILHDVGKKFISKEILLKKSAYTPEETKVYQTHPRLGYEFLKENFSMSAMAYIGVLQHHEKYDGSGYPDHRRGDEINKFAKILAVADTYDAMVSRTANQNPVLPSEAYEFIVGSSGIYFDPEVVKVFMNCVAAYPVGTKVQLSNGKSGIVAETYKGFATRPKIRVLNSDFINRYIDLKNDPEARNITIIGMEN